MITTAVLAHLLQFDDTEIIANTVEDFWIRSGKRDAPAIYSCSQIYTALRGGCFDSVEFILSYRLTHFMDNHYGAFSKSIEFEWTILRLQTSSPYPLSMLTSQACLGAFVLSDCEFSIELGESQKIQNCQNAVLLSGHDLIQAKILPSPQNFVSNFWVVVLWTKTPREKPWNFNF